MTNPRDLIQRLADALDCYLDQNPAYHRQLEALSDEARAYLAASDEPAVPSDVELLELMPEAMRDEFSYAATVCSDATGGQVKPGIFRVCLNHSALEYARAVLARWGNSTTAPIPLSERQPTEADCDAEGRCWRWHPESLERNACWCYSRGTGTEKLWLPHLVLPVPGVEA